ncbi:hypothetical protein [Clostridium perfringens]|uniref:hypothetical protein n=1 Tax=Clostridium perfringens TaxID=1502 RepID=UPI001A1A0902|nr:hypothetical protein [Clostridium perfringens]MCX0408571.1 hypothetical protein [Clostridium perfringens]HAT4331394.1 hypothetical protein [Clostridium perfringens]
MVDGMLENFEGVTVDLENKGYKIELYNSNSRLQILFRRYKGSQTKDHGSIIISRNDLDKLINSLKFMREHIDFE